MTFHHLLGELHNDDLTKFLELTALNERQKSETLKRFGEIS